MNTQTIATALTSPSLICTFPLSGCVVACQQESVGQYIDDATIITERVKARFANNPAVDGVTRVKMPPLSAGAAGPLTQHGRISLPQMAKG